MDAMKIADITLESIAQQFLELVGEHGNPRTLELGTRRWDPALSTHHQDWVPHAHSYVKSDVTDGEDVDVV